MKPVHAVFSCLAAMLFAVTLLGSPATAQQQEVPYWASLRYDEVRMRVGPSQEYPIDWIYRRKGLPVKVVRVRESWRLVEDPEGTRGWIARSQLTPERGTIIIGDAPVAMREGPEAATALRWRAEPGVVAKLLRCREGACEIDVSGRTGWVPQSSLWGAGEP